MKCPNCTIPMKPGVLRLKKSLLEFLSFRFGTRNVYFRSDDSTKDELVFHWSQKARAYRCPKCRAVTFPESK